MNDRELLEKAAKAAGIVYESRYVEPIGLPFVGLLLKTGATNQSFEWWNPLTDDGDALRLSVKLLMQVIQDRMGLVKVGWSVDFESGAPTVDGSSPWYWKEWLSDHNGDRQAATRRAIVRAAAAIGETL